MMPVRALKLTKITLHRSRMRLCPVSLYVTKTDKTSTAEVQYSTPAAFAAELKKQGAASLRIAGGYATQPLASPAHMGNNNAEALIKTG